jgi:hypothetical protein
MATTNGNGKQPKKQLILNAFVESCSGHQSPGLWRHPDDRSSEFNNIKHWIKLAQLLESGGFHGMFIADVLVRASDSKNHTELQTESRSRVRTTCTKVPRTQTLRSFRELNGPSMSLS